LQHHIQKTDGRFGGRISLSQTGDIRLTEFVFGKQIQQFTSREYHAATDKEQAAGSSEALNLHMQDLKLFVVEWLSQLCAKITSQWKNSHGS
jgi:hypothetical protein